MTNLSTQTSRSRGQRFLQELLSCRSDLSAGKATPYLETLRSQAEARLGELTIPTPRDEDWKYTDLSTLLRHSFQPQSPPSELTQPALQDYVWPEAKTSRLVVVNGHWMPQLSDLRGLPEAILIQPLSQMDPKRLQPYLQSIAAADTFTALNTASLVDGIGVILPRNLQLPQPLQILYLNVPGSLPLLSQPRCLVVAETSSSAVVIEDFCTLGAGLSLTNAVTEIALQPNAQIQHLKLQREHDQAFHISKTAVTQGRDSRYQTTTLSWGGQLSRHTLELMQTGEQAESTQLGLGLLNREQVGDSYSVVDHRAAHGRSHQIHKFIVDDRAHGIFNGKLLVQQAAQLTEAVQSSRNLLLAKQARVDTRPQLEIFADNVKCAHGATVSQLEEDEIFYLLSRGINREQAQELLTYAFAAEIIQTLPIPSIRQALRDLVLQKTNLQAPAPAP
jgi:Fe-S cluster assembly protein SufD